MFFKGNEGKREPSLVQNKIKSQDDSQLVTGVWHRFVCLFVVAQTNGSVDMKKKEMPVWFFAQPTKKNQLNCNYSPQKV